MSPVLPFMSSHKQLLPIHHAHNRNYFINLYIPLCIITFPGYQVLAHSLPLCRKAIQWLDSCSNSFFYLSCPAVAGTCGTSTDVKIGLSAQLLQEEKGEAVAVFCSTMFRKILVGFLTMTQLEIQELKRSRERKVLVSPFFPSSPPDSNSICYTLSEIDALDMYLVQLIWPFRGSFCVILYTLHRNPGT